MEMGCYGIGVSRILGGHRTNNDARGIIWPDAIAPFQVAIVRGARQVGCRARSRQHLYAELIGAGIDAFLGRPGRTPGSLGRQ